MKLISWNVNGLRACVQKGFLEQFEKLDADFFCLQETKMQKGQLELELPGYLQYWNSAEKKGYSGTAVFTRHVPLSVAYGLGDPELDTEGRLITLEYPEFYLVSCYTPNAQRGLARIDFRLRWDAAFRGYLTKLDACKPVIICGDLNVAHQEIDLKNPGTNRGNAGFSDEERESFTKTLAAGFTDTFRYLHPDAKGAYTWWSYMFNARQNNAGWRIDYFLVSDRIKDTVYKTPIYADILGSDHCPVGLELDIPCNGSIWQSDEKCEKKQTEETKPQSAGKLAVKVGALALAAAGLILGIARIQPAASLQPEPTVQTQPQETQPAENTDPPESGALFDVTIGTEELSVNHLSSPVFPYEVQLGDEKLLLGKDFKKDTWNFWALLELKEPITSTEFNNAVYYAEIAPELCSSAIAARGDGLVLNCIRVYREDGQPGGWLLIGRAARDTGVLMSVTLNGESWLQELVISPWFNKTKAFLMTTEALADYAVHLDAFQHAQGDAEVYNKLAEEDPALSELKDRADAEEWIAILADRSPELETTDYLKSVFPRLEETDPRGLTEAKASALPVEQLTWLVLQDAQLAEDLLAAEEDARAQIWLENYCLVYPAMQEFANRRTGREELLKYMCGYNGSRIQLLASILFNCPLDYPMNAYELLRYQDFAVMKAEFGIASVTEEQAEKMATEELVARIAQSHFGHNTAFLNSTSVMPSYAISSSVLIYNGEDYYYLEFREKYPIFRELEKREDAVDAMYAYCETATDATSRSRIQFLLERPVYLRKMSDKQAEDFLDGLIETELSDMRTSVLASYAIEYVMPLAWERIGQETKSYEKLTENYPIMKELESRSDCAAQLLNAMSMFTVDTEWVQRYVTFLIEQEPYRRTMTPDYEQMLASLLASVITAEKAEQMSNVQLAEKIVDLSDLRLYVTSAGYYESFFASGYESCLKKYPILAELEGRQDVVSALLDVAERQKQAVEAKVVMNILQLESYQLRMTAEEASRYMKLGEVYLWKSEIQELTTNKLARLCLSGTFLCDQLSKAETVAEAEAIYQRIVSVYPALAELEGRENLIAELLFFCNSSNLSVLPIQRQNAVSLLSLDRYYTRLTVEQQLKLADLLLEADVMETEEIKLEIAV